MSQKSQKNGQNLKKTGEKRAIFPKRPFKRACPFKNGRLSHTGPRMLCIKNAVLSDAMVKWWIGEAWRNCLRSRSPGPSPWPPWPPWPSSHKAPPSRPWEGGLCHETVIMPLLIPCHAMSNGMITISWHNQHRRASRPSRPPSAGPRYRRMATPPRSQSWGRRAHLPSFKVDLSETKDGLALTSGLDIFHYQFRNNGILKNSCCNIPL